MLSRKVFYIAITDEKEKKIIMIIKMATNISTYMELFCLTLVVGDVEKM